MSTRAALVALLVSPSFVVRRFLGWPAHLLFSRQR